MSKFLAIVGFSILFLACKTKGEIENPFQPVSEFTIAFGSCNRHTTKNFLWDDILEAAPDVWIWGGDNIYADTSDLEVIASMYQAQKRIAGYRKLRKEVPIIGSWDDHDYGINDGGVEWTAKEGSQQAFLDFMDVPETSPRRVREGIYTAYNIGLTTGRIKIIVLDTRYFRSPLTPDPAEEKRYIPNAYGQGTILGETQWAWLESELRNSKADFNILVSSIQFLSDQHGFETWGNFPHEVDRMKQLIVESGAKGVMFLSGDRHISECSMTRLEGMAYPLIDFTSSGLTHAYREFKGEPNPYRLGQVVYTESFGLVKLSPATKKARFQIVGDRGKILGEFELQY